MPMPRAADRWHAIIDRYEASGQTLREFAEANGLNRNTLSWWRWELGRSRVVRRPSFVEFVVADDDSPARASSVIIELGTIGARVVVEDDTNLDLLRRVAEALC